MTMWCKHRNCRLEKERSRSEMTIELTAPAVPEKAYDGEILPIHMIVTDAFPFFQINMYDTNLVHAFRTLDTELHLDIEGLNVVVGDEQ